MGEHDEFIADFLEECDENLDQLDQELVALEGDPRNQERLRSIFRNVHTIKGSSGFFGFVKLGALAHEGENLLGKVRDGELNFNQRIATGLLKMADAIREILAHIEQGGEEGPRNDQSLIDLLRALSFESPAEDPVEAESPQANSDVGQGQTGDVDQAAEEPALAGDASESNPSASGNSASVVQDTPQPIVRPEAIAEEEDQEFADAIPTDPTADVFSDDAEPSVRLTQTVDEESADQKTGDQQTGGQLTQNEVEQENTKQAEADRQSSGEKKPTEFGEGKSSEASSIRVDVGLLDELMDFAGELVLARNALFQCSEVTIDSRLSAVTNRVSQITSEIQDRVTRTRMQPISAIWGRFRRIVRDLSVQCGKEVRLELSGEETELDRSLLEAIRDPLTHIIRNGVDHGIETPEVREAAGKPREGRLRLWARHESGQVVIEASDDGAGIHIGKLRETAVVKNLMSVEEAAVASDTKVLQCVFEPGFSTAKKISSISGRGVGMDVVRNHIEKIGGSVQLQSVYGQGTTLIIKIPLTLAIVPALMVAAGGQKFVVPQASLSEVISVGGTTPIERVHDVPVCRLRDRLLPLVQLDQLLGMKEPSESIGHPERSTSPVAVLKVDQFRYGLVIDEVLNTHEIVVKPIGASVKSIGAFAAATILGDGSVALILDVGGIAKLGGLLGEDPEKQLRGLRRIESNPDMQLLADLASADIASDPTLESLLVCEIGEGRRLGIPTELVERLEEIQATDIEQMDFGLVASYRGAVLPIMTPGDSSHLPLVGKGQSPSQDTPKSVHVVVLRLGDELVGAVVQRVVDIVAVSRVTESGGSDSGTGGLKRYRRSTVLNGQLLEIMDLNRLREVLPAET